MHMATEGKNLTLSCLYTKTVNVSVICCWSHFKIAFTFLQNTNYKLTQDWNIGVMYTQ